jgi:hypothetical protein
MQSSKPILDVWDSCCLIGILNGEQDKLPALLAQTRFFETGAAMLSLPIAVLLGLSHRPKPFSLWFH